MNIEGLYFGWLVLTLIFTAIGILYKGDWTIQFLASLIGSYTAIMGILISNDVVSQDVTLAGVIFAYISLYYVLIVLNPLNVLLILFTKPWIKKDTSGKGVSLV